MSWQREKECDYFENSRRATLLQQQYAIRNPGGYAGYGALCLELAACPWPEPARHVIAPCSGNRVPTIASIRRRHLGGGHRNGYETVFNPTFQDPGGSKDGWVSPSFCGLNQGPIVIMVENFGSGLVWKLLRGCDHVVVGLKAAGFTGGWLDAGTSPPDRG